MDKDKGLKDRIIEFLTVSATMFTLVVLLGVALKAVIILVCLGMGLGYITTIHIKNFFQTMSGNIEEIKNYIKGKELITREAERKMEKAER